MQAYCMKCRKKVEIENLVQVEMRNGRPAIRGSCPSCRANIFTNESPKLQDKCVSCGLLFGVAHICPKCGVTLQEPYLATPTIHTKEGSLCQFCARERKMDQLRHPFHKGIADWGFDRA